MGRADKGTFKPLIANDKYYTSPILAKYLIDKTLSIVDENNITNVVEPSAGNGSFSLQIACDAYDIEPEDQSIIKQDYLTLELPYLKGRLIIGNPPFGKSSGLAKKFIIKSLASADYVAFILPSCFYKKNRFDNSELIHSELIDAKQKYSGHVVLTCFNIYKRVKNKKYTHKTLSVIDIIEVQKGKTNYKDYKYDIRLSAFGRGKNFLKINPERDEPFTRELLINFNNHSRQTEITNFLEFNLRERFKHQNNISKQDLTDFIFDYITTHRTEGRDEIKHLVAKALIEAVDDINKFTN